MKAAVLTEYRKFEWKEDVPVPKMEDNEVLVRVEYAGICGSDMHIFNGDFEPRTTVPMIPGHEFAGIVHDAGKNVQKFSKGERVVVDPIIWCGECAACQIGHYPACTSLKLLGVDMNGGFGEYINVKEHMLFKVSESVSARDAALVEIYSIGFHACNRANVQDGDTVAIWGTGRVGQSILQAVKTKTKNTVFCVDIVTSRLENAKKAYPDIVTINLMEENPFQIIKDKTDGRGTDIAFEAVGHAMDVPNCPNPIRGCVQSIRGAGTVCVLGLGDDPSPVLFKELIWKEAKIVASRVSHGEFEEAVRHLEKGDLNPDSLISKEMDGKEAQAAFEMVEASPEKYLKVLLKIS